MADKYASGPIYHNEQLTDSISLIIQIFWARLFKTNDVVS